MCRQGLAEECRLRLARPILAAVMRKGSTNEWCCPDFLQRVNRRLVVLYDIEQVARLEDVQVPCVTILSGASLLPKGSVPAWDRGARACERGDCLGAEGRRRVQLE
jgi:hypothetical protein